MYLFLPTSKKMNFVVRLKYIIGEKARLRENPLCLIGKKMN